MAGRRPCDPTASAKVGARVTVPATAPTQAVRPPDRQIRLARLIPQPATDVGAEAGEPSLPMDYRPAACLPPSCLGH